jgi:ribosomal protein L9
MKVLLTKDVKTLGKAGEMLPECQKGK